jgi:predicted DsbA family dithiol-disulfide isomerase
LKQETVQTLAIFSDYICPFCFIGKQRAERLAREFPLEIVWKGLEIHPEVPPQGIPLEAFMPEMLANLETQVRILAEEIGLEMRMPERLSNSHLALLGTEYAREYGTLEKYHEMVFSAYFQDRKDIGEIETLIDLWKRIDDDDISFREALLTERHASHLKNSIDEAHSLGISAVPAFVFSSGTIILGAQPYDILSAAAEKSLQNS